MIHLRSLSNQVGTLIEYGKESVIHWGNSTLVAIGAGRTVIHHQQPQRQGQRADEGVASAAAARKRLAIVQAQVVAGASSGLKYKPYAVRQAAEKLKTN